MPKGQNQKLKLLLLLRILERESDCDHPIPMPEIIRRLAENGVTAQRQSIYDDLLMLDTLGYTVEHIAGRNGGYYLDTRLFEMPELKMLVDAVSAARFIPEEKSRAIVKKLESTVSRFDAQRLDRETFVPDRTRVENKAVFYAVDTIHTAIAENKKISFCYFKRNEKKERVLRRDGALYTVSPYKLVWSEENYYLIAYETESDTVRHYRVDKMQSVNLRDEKREGESAFMGFDLASYMRSHFSMFSGKRELVTLDCASRLADVILDRFGTGVTLIPSGEGRFRVTVPVVVSSNFLAYTMGYGEDMYIASPESARRAARELIDKAKRSYGEEKAK